MTNITKVGIGIAILRYYPNEVVKVLLGKRMNSHGEGEWGLPGGHMEYLESFEVTALREMEEEIGPVKVDGIRVVSVINLTAYAPKHYIDIGMTAEWVSGEAEVMEPFKCETWEWFEIDNLPSPRFATVDRIVDAAVSPHLYKYNTTVVYDKE